MGPSGGILYYAVQGAFLGFLMNETRAMMQIKATEKYFFAVLPKLSASN